MGGNKPERVYELAYEYYLEYGTCSQCVISAIMEVMEIDLKELMKASYFLAGGGCLTGDGICGALVAGELILGSFYGRGREDFGNRKFRSNLLIGKELVDQFNEEFGGMKGVALSNLKAGIPLFFLKILYYLELITDQISWTCTADGTP